jgi:hypothetical protein
MVTYLAPEKSALNYVIIIIVIRVHEALDKIREAII